MLHEKRWHWSVNDHVKTTRFYLPFLELATPLSIQKNLCINYTCIKITWTQHTHWERENRLATEVWYAGTTFRILLLFPYPPCDAKFELFPISSREEKGHVALNNETIMTISDLPVTISNASWCALPDELPAISSNLQAIAVVPSFCLITHKTKKCHINRSHTKLKCLKMETKILSKAVKDLTDMAKEMIRYVDVTR